MGNGYTSNSDPYAHWGPTFADTLAATPTKTCTYANSGFKYDQVRGNWCMLPCRTRL